MALSEPQALFENKLALTYRELAEAIGMSQSHLKKLVKTKTIPFARIGKSVRFIPEDIRAWLKKETHAS